MLIGIMGSKSLSFKVIQQQVRQKHECTWCAVSFHHTDTPWGSIEGFTVADVILEVGQSRQNLQWIMEKIVILMLDNSRKADILNFLWIAN